MPNDNILSTFNESLAVKKNGETDRKGLWKQAAKFSAGLSKHEMKI